MENKKAINKLKKLKIIFIVICTFFCIPSIVYIIYKGNILNLNSSFSMFYSGYEEKVTNVKIISGLLFTLIFSGITYLYFLILKNQKLIFKNIKDVIFFVIIISIIFTIILPITSTDIFYYIGTGWSEARYGINPYYTSINDLITQNPEILNDEIMLKASTLEWSSQKIVYGPIWPLICKILSSICCGNLGIALIIYKIFNLCLHILNTYFIYRITKNKKIFALIYGINPLILFQGLSNVHNEILVIFFSVVSLYFFVRKKKILLTLLFLALATGVKYYPILLAPFIVLYYYKNEKITKKLMFCVIGALFFITIIAIFYTFYIQNINIFRGILDQQQKFSNCLYTVLAIENINLAFMINKICTICFMGIYVICIIKIIFTKKTYNFSNYIRNYNYLLLIFIFTVITNFESWYILWLFPTIMWLKSKQIINILYISISVEIANVVYYMLYESYEFSIYYCILIFMTMLFMYSNKIKNIKIKKYLEEK